MNGKVWVDITDLQGWNGRFAGTQRVTYNLALQYYLLDREHAGFVSFSSDAGGFHEVDFETIILGSEPIPEASDVIISEPSVSSLRRAIVYVEGHIPAIIKRRALFWSAAKVGMRVGRGIRRRLFSDPFQHEQNPETNAEGQPALVAFSQNDVVLVLGKPWDYPGLQDLLIRQKPTAGFLVVQIVYDLLISLHPQLHQAVLFQRYSEYMFDAAQVSDLLICISEHTKRDLFEFCDLLCIERPHAEVVRIGDEIDGTGGGGDVNVSFTGYVPGSFILCVGTIEIRKNHSLLYQVYKLAHERNIDLPKLVIVGKRGWLTQSVLHLIEHDPDVRDAISVRDDIGDSQLAWLYKNCLFSIYPSMYEGWGLPVAESLQYGKLCIASNASSIPEIGGGLVEYFSPYDADECLRVMQTALVRSERELREAKIRSEYVATPWSATFAKLNSLIDDIISR